MNQKQRQYATDRLTALAGSKIEELKKEYTVPCNRMPSEDKLSLLETVGLYVHSHAISNVHHVDDKPAYLSEEGINEVKIVRDALDKAKDVIMLGDNTEALETIKQFEGTL